jgi:DNA polymerase-3 subunit alpha
LNWFPLKNHTHYSLLSGFSKPDDLVAKCKENGYVACGIADYKTISGCISFFQACKKANIKPILGCSFDNFKVFAKNQNGWHDLIELISSLDENEDLDNSVLESIIGRGNLIKVIDSETQDQPTSFYVNKEDAKLHRILLCSDMKITLPKIHKWVKKDKNGNISIDPKLPKEYHNKVSFFVNENYYVKSKEETKDINTKLLEDIYNQCEDFNILSNPILPKFSCPNDLSEEDYLKELCRVGWKNLLINQDKVSKEEDKKIYLDRFKEEFDVIKDANLFGYFLIVRDIIKYVNDQGWMSGPGRGSAAGCLISYLIGITQIDPVEYDLLFERFYNAGRNTKDNISLPDIDMDVPSTKRDDVINYLKTKYGNDKVSQMVTFGRLQGKSAIKEVLRIHEACSFAEMNAISNCIPDEAKISDQLAEMDDEDRSIIRWALINNSEQLSDFCKLSDDNKLEGEYADYFDQAIKIEGTFKSRGKHAAGVVISAKPLHKVCPMTKQKGSSEKIAGLEMSDLESLGHVKFDVLGVNLLDKLMYIETIARN